MHLKVDSFPIRRLLLKTVAERSLGAIELGRGRSLGVPRGLGPPFPFFAFRGGRVLPKILYLFRLALLVLDLLLTQVLLQLVVQLVEEFAGRDRLELQFDLWHTRFLL